MQVDQRLWSKDGGWSGADGNAPDPAVQLVLMFGGRDVFKDGALLKEVAVLYPNAERVGCSTAGEIQDVQVHDDTLAVTAVTFKSTTVQSAWIDVTGPADSYAAGTRLAAALPHKSLKHVFVLSDGLAVNGSDLARGLIEALPDTVTLTGGLSGDGARFEETYVACNEKTARNGICAIGFYGDSLRIGFGSQGGWDPFGTERVITRANGNVLYEMDGQSALELYKRYLGDQAAELPAAGLLFPLAVRPARGGDALVRTILAVDEEDGSLTFAGDVPEGHYARLMKANFNRLIDGAQAAAQASSVQLGSDNPCLAILISCVGRKMVLKQRTEEEVEAVRESLGPNAALAGFYSYGEMSPLVSGGPCELHNQTMTITTISE